MSLLDLEHEERANRNNMTAFLFRAQLCEYKSDEWEHNIEAASMFFEMLKSTKDKINQLIGDQS